MSERSEKVLALEAQLSEPPNEDEPPVFAEDGTDLTQIRYMLSLTPAERIIRMQKLASSILKMRRTLERRP